MSTVMVVAIFSKQPGSVRTAQLPYILYTNGTILTLHVYIGRLVGLAGFNDNRYIYIYICIYSRH